MKKNDTENEGRKRTLKDKRRKERKDVKGR